MYHLSGVFASDGDKGYFCSGSLGYSSVGYLLNRYEMYFGFIDSHDLKHEWSPKQTQHQCYSIHRVLLWGLSAYHLLLSSGYAQLRPVVVFHVEFLPNF